MEKRRLYCEEWRRVNPEKMLAAVGRWKAANPEATKRHVRDANLRRYYGMTIEKFEAMWEAQDRGCAVCRGACLGKREPAVDHCHTTGTVRALLCHGCNTALGLAKENPTTLRALADYAEKWVSTVDNDIETV